ncbi:MAG TPA: hypothetical protein VI279_04995 [Rhodocyclaceae bacterium]
MSHIEFTEQEREILEDVLRSALSDLKTEVSHTDRRDYRAALKQQEQIVRQILDKVGCETEVRRAA